MKWIMSILLLLSMSMSNRAYAKPSAYSKTYNDVQTFLKADTTDQLPYNYDTFNCVNYSETLIQHARAAGFIAVYVGLDWTNLTDGHEFVAFYTVDYGVMYIEPQNDAEYAPPDAGGQLCWRGGDCFLGQIGHLAISFDPIN